VDIYLRTNHWIDAVTSLETAQEFCSRVTLDETYWKWTLIAVHSGVQGFMVLALEHGNALLAMKNDIAARWLKAHNAGAPYPEEKMDFFLNLYEKVKSDAVCRYVESKKFVPGPSHDYSMKKLNELRNNFIHFLPKVWSVELTGLPAVCLGASKLRTFSVGNREQSYGMTVTYVSAVKGLLLSFVHLSERLRRFTLVMRTNNSPDRNLCASCWTCSHGCLM
jgi:hypothetical protein